ncbi:MAG: hypothetical protein FWC75_03670 [Oscillospiraceae bacterium]|nr:hypothetical protein [Oscillospiraceae bacterium]
MSGSKIRNIVIVSLLLINILFLAIIIIDVTEDARLERVTLENVSAILYAGGITIDPEHIVASDALRSMRTARMVDVERSIANALLGETTITDQGVIYLYESPYRGVAEFYSAGDFEIRLLDGVIVIDGTTIRTVRLLLRNMEIETTDIVSLVDPETGNERVYVNAAYRGASIFNCVIVFEFEAESLVSVGGRYVAGIEAVEDSVALPQVSSALLRFLAAVKDEELTDFECREILAVRAGFRHRVVGSLSEGIIDPVWLITTGNARFMIDSDGEIWPL